jgi:hypothetical protein
MSDRFSYEHLIQMNHVSVLLRRRMFTKQVRAFFILFARAEYALKKAEFIVFPSKAAADESIDISVDWDRFALELHEKLLTSNETPVV